MLHPQALIQLFGHNAIIIEKQLVGITHEQSLIQPVNTPNSLNWLLGHMVSSRTIALERVKAEPVWSDEGRLRYRNGSAPITSDGEGVLRFEKILADFRLSQERLIRGLSSMTYEQMSEPTGYNDQAVGPSIVYFQFHETYHIGQMTVVAMTFGKDTAWL
jgi:uncharacterized damage-inducible protein DinB